MKTLRTLAIGTLIWILGVSVYCLSFYTSFIEDLEQQANLVLSLAILPIVWMGCHLYHKKDITVYGFIPGLSFFVVSAIMDALITVPMIILPNGGSYYEFYTDLGFWVIGLEFVGVSMLYSFFQTDLKIKETDKPSNG